MPLEQDALHCLQMTCMNAPAYVAGDDGPTFHTWQVMMGHYSYCGQHPKADCVELAVRELLNILLWDEQTQR